MKQVIKMILLMAIVTLPVAMHAQSSAIDRYYDNFRQDEQFTLITVSSKMFSLFVNFEMDDPAEQEIVKTISKLKGLKMLVGSEIADAKSVFQKADKQPGELMEELMAITDAKKEFKFYITEANGLISELLMVGYEDQQVIMLSLVGEINLKEIAALSKKMDIDGFEHFQNVDRK